MSRHFVFTLITALVILALTGAGILLVKGYKFSFKNGQISGTGIISITSEPEGASVFIDNHLTSATNTTIPSLVPKSYDVRVVKEGLIPWQKKVTVREGLVSELKITLFPAIPTVSPLTFNGAVNPLLSPDGNKLAFFVPIATNSGSLKQRGGVWVLNMVSQPISFSRSSGSRQLISSTQELEFAKGKLRFSPDSKSVLVTVQEGGREGVENQRNFILSVDQTTALSNLVDITPTVDSTIKTWDEEIKRTDEARILAIKNSTARKIASDSAQIKWAPDETKFMFGVSSTNISRVYDLAEDKQYNLPQAHAYLWLPDSRHIILVKDGKIGVIEFDGINESEVFAGNFLNGFVFPWPDSSKLVILSSIPTPTASQPNLFGVNLK